MAQECVQPQNDWDTVPIELTTRDVDNYECGLKDIIRLSLGKSTVTSSENEERGRGKRKSRPNHRLNFESHCVKECNSSEGDCEDGEPSPIADANKTKVLPTLPVLTPLLKKPRKENDVKSPAAPTHCQIKTKKHSCPFDFEGVNFDHALGHAFCSLSRDISKINANLSHLRECQDELQKSVDLLMTKNCNGAENADPNIAVAHFPQAIIIEDLPIASLDKLIKFEKKTPGQGVHDQMCFLCSIIC
ncbi:uncharacterized protein LOC111057065 [Nilaparvata lugens]|uniref:uncharacterized protein LOC111057065 n=1 Tax=Nilaparvata lugens TaxID=108931 RepID=UPI00193DA9F8|nr:uncharacterized protein LOC111057065 [Nilaparvata lugens]